MRLELHLEISIVVKKKGADSSTLLFSFLMIVLSHPLRLALILVKPSCGIGSVVVYPGLWKGHILEALLVRDVSNFLAPGNPVELLLNDVTFEFLGVFYSLFEINGCL